MHVIDFKDHVTVRQRRLADLPDRVVDGDPHHETQMRFKSADATMLAGTWTSTPGKWVAFADRDEFCVLLSARQADLGGWHRTGIPRRCQLCHSQRISRFLACA